MPDVFRTNKRKKPKAINLADKSGKRNLKNKSLKFERKILTGKASVDHSPLSAFRFYPDRAEFYNKDPEEKVILLLRKHPITNLRWIGMAIVMLLTPAFISVLSFFEALPYGFKIIGILGWYLVTLAYIFEKFLSWFYNVNIITDERMFDVDFHNMVYREMTDANIDQIQDVTVEIGGPIRTVFNFGNVVIQTAAEIPQIEFEAVPQPDKVARVLRELKIEEEVEKLEGRIR